MSKITIKHFLNKKLSPYGTINNEYQYPIYFRVIYNRISTTYKSNIQKLGYATESQIINDLQIINDIKYEIELINFIINYSIINFKNLFSVKGINVLVFLTNISIKELLYKDLCLTENQKVNLENYLSKKTDLSNDLIKNLMLEIIKIDEIEHIKQLFNKQIVDNDKKNIIDFYTILRDFENFNYKNQIHWGASTNLNFFEWKMRNKKIEFINYVTENNLLEENILNNCIFHLEKLFYNSIKNKLQNPVTTEFL